MFAQQISLKFPCFQISVDFRPLGGIFVLGDFELERVRTGKFVDLDS